MKTANATLLTVMLLLAGCQMFEKPVVADQPMTFPDNSAVDVGQPFYLDDEGKATGYRIDPETGKPNKIFTEIDEKQAQDIANVVEGGTSWIPYVGTGIGAVIVSLLTAGGMGAIRKRNAQKRAEAGLPPKATAST